MSSNINSVVLIGRLTKDPELRHTPGGTAVCELSLAVNGREKDASGDWAERADFFDVTVWGNQGENCARYLSKGKQCAVDGRLRQDRWEKDGQKRSAVKIIANSVQFFSRESDGDSGASSDAAPDDDLPF